MSRRFEVRLGTVPVGELSELPDGGTELRFYDSYRQRVGRPVLGQKFEDDLERTYRSRKSQRLPDFFANLIPEGRLRRYVEREAGLDEGDDLDLLAYVGRDLPGAVLLVELGGAPLFTPSEPAPAGAEPPETVAEAFRFSLAGVQLKFSMLREEEKLSLPASDRTGDWTPRGKGPHRSDARPRQRRRDARSGAPRLARGRTRSPAPARPPAGARRPLAPRPPPPRSRRPRLIRAAWAQSVRPRRLSSPPRRAPWTTFATSASSLTSITASRRWRTG